MSEPIRVPGQSRRPASLIRVRRSRAGAGPRCGGLDHPAGVVISLLAAGLAGWAAFALQPAAIGNPASPTPRAGLQRLLPGEQRRRTAVHIDADQDPVAQQAIAANARLAMTGGADYIRSKLASNTPADLAEPLASFADQLQTIAQYYLAGQTNENPEQAAASPPTGSKTLAAIYKQ